MNDIYHIAIDGPVASGKGTVAKGLSEKLGIPCLDTGAMYRAFAVHAGESKDVEGLLKTFNLETIVSDKTYVKVNGVDVTNLIRQEHISMLSSYLSSYPIVRERMVALQQEIAKTQSFILEGRDIASVVLPDAKFKFYLTACVKTRALRRQAENKAKGIEITLEEMMRQIEERDHNDKNKEVGSLVCVADAIVVDNTDMSIEQTIAKFVETVYSK